MAAPPTPCSKAAAEANRKKAWRPKVKTGCATCKARRVKCDEAKPSCQRCTSANRKCEGYVETPVEAPIGHKWIAYQSSKSTTRKQHCSLGVGSVLVAMQKPDFALLLKTWDGSSSEKRSFHYFVTELSAEMNGLLTDVSFWPRGMPLVTVHVPTARHLLIALAAAHEQYAGGKNNEEFILKQSNLAIKYLLRASETTKGIKLSKNKVFKSTFEQRQVYGIMIMASLVFTYISTLQNKHSEAMQHLRSGLKVFAEVEEKTDAFDLTKEDLCPVGTTSLRSHFTALDIQAWMQLGPEDLTLWPALRQRMPSCKTHLRYETVIEAQDDVEKIFHYVHSIIRLKDNNRSLCETLQRSIMAFDALLDKKKLETWSNADQNRIQQIRIYHSLLELWLLESQKAVTGRCTPGQVASYGEESAITTARMELIVECATDLFEKTNKPGSRRPLFTPGLGAVLPLYIVSYQSRDPITRGKARDLLTRFPRCEGLWDCSQVARVGLDEAGGNSLHCPFSPKQAEDYHYFTIPSIPQSE